MLHFGRGIFGSDYGTVAFVISKITMLNYKGTYKKLFERAGLVETEEVKREKFFSNSKNYYTKQALYELLPNTLFAYWATNAFVDAFISGKYINNYAIIFEGLKTRDKERFLRLWFEVASNKWKPYAKGGAFRRWYGNNDYVVKDRKSVV